MNLTSFTGLSQNLVDICASYISPPELRYIARYEPPAGADATVTEIFRQFQASYASPATWDLQAGIDPRGALAGTGRQAIERYYRDLNASLGEYTENEVSESEDPFLANAHLQGLLIQKFFTGGYEDSWVLFLQHSNDFTGFSLPIKIKRPVSCALSDLSLLQTAFSPVLALEENGSVEVLSEAFYGPGALELVDDSTAASEPVQVAITANRYRNSMESHSLATFNRWFTIGYEQLYMEYGGFQDLATLKSHTDNLLELDSSLQFNPNAKKAVLPSPFSLVRQDMASRLEMFQRHFRNVLSTGETAVLRQHPFMVDNTAIRKFLFDTLRKVLNTPTNQATPLIARLVKEEIVSRKLLSEKDLNKKYLLYGEPFDLEIASDVMTDFIKHLNHLQNNTTLKQGSAGAVAVERDVSIDEDANTKGYLILLQRLFKEVIIPAPDQDTVHSLLLKAARILIEQAPSCEATCAFFTLLYQEARRRKLTMLDGMPIDAQSLLAMGDGIQNAKLKQLFQELAAKEAALGEKPPAIPEKG